MKSIFLSFSLLAFFSIDALAAPMLTRRATPSEAERSLFGANNGLNAAGKAKVEELVAGFSKALDKGGLFFVGKTCTSDSQCQQGCCGFSTGQCAGPGIAQTARGGCGHGDPKPNCIVAQLMQLNVCVAGGIRPEREDILDITRIANGVFSQRVAENVNTKVGQANILDTIGQPARVKEPKKGKQGKKPASAPQTGTGGGGGGGKDNGSNNEGGFFNAQNGLTDKGKERVEKLVKEFATSRGFVTKNCEKDSDCQQGCCGRKTGKCAGPGIAQTERGGCGRGDPQANCIVAELMRLNTCVAGGIRPQRKTIKDLAIIASAVFSQRVNENKRNGVGQANILDTIGQD